MSNYKNRVNIRSKVLSARRLSFFLNKRRQASFLKRILAIEKEIPSLEIKKLRTKFAKIKKDYPIIFLFS